MRNALCPFNEHKDIGDDVLFPQWHSIFPVSAFIEPAFGEPQDRALRKLFPLSQPKNDTIEPNSCSIGVVPSSSDNIHPEAGRFPTSLHCLLRNCTLFSAKSGAPTCTLILIFIPESLPRHRIRGQAHSHMLPPSITNTACPPPADEMSDHIISQLTDRRTIILFLNALDDLPPEILRLIAGRIVAKLCPGVVQVHGVNNLSSSVLRRLSFSRRLASAAMHELPRIVRIEYDAPRLEFDLLQYSTPLARTITWLPFSRRQLQHLSLLLPLGGVHAHYLPGMTESIATLPQIFPGLKSLELVMNWSGQFIISGQNLADLTQTITLIQSGELGRVVGGFLAIVNALANVRLAQKSVNDSSWAIGAVSFNGSRKAAMARLLGEDLMS